MTGLEFWDGRSGDGLVPSVEVSDLKEVWTTTQQHSPGAFAYSAFTSKCNQDTDLTTVLYRVSMLQLLANHAGLLPPELPSEIRDVVFAVAADFPMKRAEIGRVYEGPPMDLQGFVEKIEQELRLLGASRP